MSRPTPETLAPPANDPAPAYPPRLVPARPPSREEVESGDAEVLRRREWGNADLLLVDVGDGLQVVKDFRHKPWLTRTVGRVLIWNECRAYRWLGDMAGVPAFSGRVDPWALAMVKIDGVLLLDASDVAEKGESYLAQLRRQIARFEARGFWHFDLRGRRNVMLARDGEVVALDFAGSLWFDPAGMVGRMMRPCLELFYQTVEIKWRALLAPDGLSEADRRRLKWLNRLRALWFIN